jgi:hypothetical protein
MKAGEPNASESPNTAVRKRTPLAVVRADGRKLGAKINAVGKRVVSSGRKDLREDKQAVAIMKKALTEGRHISVACRLAGFSPQSFSRWMRQGEEAPEGTLAKKFYDIVEFAKAKGIHRFVTRIQKKGDKSGDWRADAWLLERFAPEHYGKQVALGKAEVKSYQAPYQVEPSALGDFTDEQRKAALIGMLSLELNPVLKNRSNAM